MNFQLINLQKRVFWRETFRDDGVVGFSLIELIVAMTIVMVVTMVGVVSYQGANRKARDGKRKADLEKIRVALEIYRQENDYYPETADSDLVPDYLQGWPDDPRNNSYYYLRGWLERIG